ncbi:MAG TPA: hypothetical protein VMU36_10550 [Spirochaetia bacterium]|nr:hypothetical protein [Spirochaetia bacterium]
MRLRAGVVLPLFLIVAALPLHALEISSGRTKLSLFEGIGRFNFSYRTAAGDWIPLLSPQDPRTSTLSLVLGSRVFRLGDSADFVTTLRKTSAGARFVWKSDSLVVTEAFSFISSVGSTVADGIRIDLTMKNTSHQDLTAGVRYLFDTWLGETSPAHFTTDTGLEIKRETMFSGGNLPRWWVSPKAGDSEQVGLQCMVTEDGVTQPDRIVFANWKRLSDSAWSYTTSSTRDFSLLPYSKNDSAVALYYDPRPLAQGSQYTVTLVLGKFNPAGFPAPSAAPASDFQSVVQQSLAAGKAAPDSPSGLHADLDAVNAILSRLDDALAAGADISDADLDLVESTIRDLSARSPTSGK